MRTDLLPPEHPLHLSNTKVFHGPNPWAMTPVVVCELEVKPGTALGPDAWALLKVLCPAWAVPEPGTGIDAHPSESGDVSLELAHRVVEWTLAALNEVRGCVQAGGVLRHGPGRFVIWVGFHHPQVTLRAMRLAVSAIALACSAQQAFAVAGIASGLDKLWPACRRWHPDYQARILMTAARAMDVPVLPFVNRDSRLWQFGWGRRSRIFFESQSNEDGSLGHAIAGSKASAKDVLRALGFPVAPHVLVTQAAELPDAAAQIGWPCATKPLDRGGGKGVTAGVRNLPDLEAAFAHARSYTQGAVMIEGFVEGHDHRLMVVGGRLAVAIRRDPPTVVGDAQRSVRSLIEVLNRGRGPNLVASRYRRAVKIDEVVRTCLQQQGLDLDDVPAMGRQVTLRSNSNMSTGGSCTEVTDRVHPAITRMAESIATSLGLATCGVDYITTDISRPWRETGGAVIEINSVPGLEGAIATGADEVLVGSQILGSVPGRLPVTLLLASTELQQAWMPGLQAEASRLPGQAWLCAGEAGVGEMPVSQPGRPVHERVASLLRNRLTDALLVVCTSAELEKEGLPVDRLDRVLLCQQNLPAEWMRVLGAAAGSVQRLDEAAAAWAAALSA
jgi:cyanophycin synthetase